MAPDEPLQRSFTLIRGGLGSEPAVALEDGKDHGLGTGTPAALTPNSSRTKAGFTYFDRARKRAVTLAFLGRADPGLEADGADRGCAYAGQFRSCGGVDIQGKIANQAPKSLLGKPGTAVISAFPCHCRRLTPIPWYLTS